MTMHFHYLDHKIPLIAEIASQFLDMTNKMICIKAKLTDKDGTILGHHYSPIKLIEQICDELHQIELSVEDSVTGESSSQIVDIKNLATIELDWY